MSPERIASDHIDSVSREAAATNGSFSVPSLHGWMLLFDELLFSTVALAKTYETIAASATDERFFLALFSIHNRIANDLAAIRRLVHLGFDVQAKAIARPLLEAFDLALAMYIDPEIAREFATTSDMDRAKEFWHSYMSRNKLQKKIGKFVESEGLINPFGPQGDQGFLKEEELIISGTSHPSFFSGILNTLVSIDDSGYRMLRAFGNKSDISTRTLKLITYKGAMYFLLSRVPLGLGLPALAKVAEESETLKTMATLRGEPLCDHALASFNVIPELFGFFLANQHTGVLGLWGQSPASK